MELEDFVKYCKLNNIKEEEALIEINDAVSDILNFIIEKTKELEKFPECATSRITSLFLCSFIKFLTISKEILSPDDFSQIIEGLKEKMKEVFNQF